MPNPLGSQNQTNMKFTVSGINACLLRYAFCLIAISIFFNSCTEEVPVHINGKVIHAITGEPIQNATVRVENILCSGFSPAICNSIRLREDTNNKGEFSFQFFQDCETEISADYIETEGVSKKKRFIYEEVAGRDDDESCNGYPKVSGDDGYFFEIIYQPVFYVDIYAVDDPELDLETFTFDGERLEIIKSSHFQKRFKIDLESFTGQFIFTSNYRNPNITKDVVEYDYNIDDELVYELRY
jgi:hypothetical protein